MNALPWPELLDAFAASPKTVRAAWDATLPPRRTIRGGEGWCANDVAVHLADAEFVRAFRARILAASGAARLDPFDEDGWRVTLRYEAADPEVALAAYAATVAATADLLRRLGEVAGERGAPHPELGLVTVRILVERGIEHAAMHAAQMRALAGP